MTDAPARPATDTSAAREFKDQIERLIDILVGAINRAASVNIDIGYFLDPEAHDVLLGNLRAYLGDKATEQQMKLDEWLRLSASSRSSSSSKAD
jgi:hypothetical protein